MKRVRVVTVRCGESFRYRTISLLLSKKESFVVFSRGEDGGEDEGGSDIE